ncbi:MAG TPA: hypothetical protein VNM91_06470, partial [Dehalococcoidia bacterium]|nr:hypothetical protein [Dehalococcoidia bacterium]
SELPVNAQPAEDAGIGPTADAGGAGAIELDAPAERAVPADGDGALMRGTPKPDPRDAARDNGSAHRRANQRGWQIWRRASPDDPDPDAIDQRLLSLRLQPERVVREEPRVMAGEDVPPPRVRVVSGPGTGTCIAVAAGEGADDAVVVPGDEGPSFRIWQRADNYVLERLRDDVRVAGARSDLPVVLLDDGDEITAGATVFRFEISPGVAQSGKRIARSI